MNLKNIVEKFIKWVNPVIIKAAIQKDKKYNYLNKLKRGIKTYDSSIPPLSDNPPTPPTAEELKGFENYEKDKMKKQNEKKTKMIKKMMKIKRSIMKN